jgi:hypothetical protein
MSPRKSFFVALAAVSAVSLVGQTSDAALTFVQADTSFPISLRPEQLIPADMNGDGLDDVVVISRQTDAVNILIASPGQPSGFSPVPVERFGNLLRLGDVGDLTRDGRPDLAVPDQRQSGVWVLVGTEGGRLSNPGFFPVGRSPFAVAIADFDGLRGADIAVADQQLGNVTILLNDGGSPPRFSRGPIYAVGEDPRTLLALDVNGDGRPDLVTLNEGTRRVKSISVLVFSQVTAGLPVFVAAQSYGVGERPEAMIPADVNGDERTDLVMLNRPGGGNSDVNLLINRGDGAFDGPTGFPIPCPFYASGAPCRATALAAADFDGNGNVDLAVLMVDPRRLGSGAGVEHDAMQMFGGRGDGGFLSGGILRTPKSALAAVAVDLNGDDKIDLAAGFQRNSNVTSFLNTSTPGEFGNGEPCTVGGNCLSGLCIEGFCCASACEDDESCAVPRREGTCERFIEVVECGFDDECFDIPVLGAPGTCVDGFCCENGCIEGRCDITGFEGLCIPALLPGFECFDERDCQSGFCVDERCCMDACDDGFCGGDDGVCRERFELGTPCDVDGECETEICDRFTGVCCSDVCTDVEECNEEGNCVLVDPMPGDGEAGDSCRNGNDCQNQTCVNSVCCVTDSCPVGEVCQPPNGECAPEPTATPTPIPQVDGSPCDEPAECISGNCVDFVCCVEDTCPGGEFCSADEGGACAPGMPPATPTAPPVQVCVGVPCASERVCIERDGRGVCVDECNGGFCEPAESCVPEAGGGETCVDTCRDVQCDAGSTCVIGNGGEAVCAIPCGTGTFCEPGEVCQQSQLGDPLCVRSSRSGGCVVTEGRSANELWALALLPIALWMRRRQVLPQRALVRARRR